MARQAGHLAAEVLEMIGPHVVPGVSTETLDRLCHEHIVNVQGAIPANVGYQGYPKTILTSVNQVVCHGIPSADKVLKKGDIVNIDVAVIKDGWFGDTSRMFFVGEPGTLARRLVETTYEAMLAGIRPSQARCHAGRRGPRDPVGGAARAFQRGARILRPWHRADLPRETRRAALRAARRRHGTGAWHGVHHRADAQRGQTRNPADARRPGRW